MNRDFAVRLRNAAFCAIVIALVAYASYTWSLRHETADIKSRADMRLAAARTALFAPTEKYSYLPGMIASHPQVVDLFRSRQEAGRTQQANQFLEQLNANAKSAVIYLLDRNGLVIASSNWNQPQSFIGHNYAFRPYFKEAIAGGRGSFYGMGTTSLMPGYYLSEPVRTGTVPAGVAVVKIDMSELDQAWHDATDEVEVFVTDENGVIFLSSQADWKYRSLHALTEQARSRLAASRQYEGVLKPPLPMTVAGSAGREAGDGRMVSITQVPRKGRGVEEVSYYQKSHMLDNAQWTVHVLVPMNAAELHARRIAAMTAGTLALLAISLLYAAQWRYRIRERERSRLALEEAHRALEEKHAELQQLSEELRLAAITDPLTGAYNRRFFFESMPRMVSAARRHHFPLSVITIDVDHFKRINDTHGHATGDKVLLMLTSTCRDSLRQADIFARFGGEEFVMALPNTIPEVAVQVAERLRKTVSELTIDTVDGPLAVSISGGVSQYRESEADMTETLRRADLALYEAKNQGRNRIVLRLEET
ncbi:sensor domain-containing diguanylate cyclase [Noviherbaspirillum aerium]|uniref:sensor domain-containing diguanylate cyclase n=1 Tax=Noviherbaspirillum aerium TaxID=2588497 RepID=UPI00124EA45B|nr:sensor domain-containing diguanylate cyclase [Noviherbaspirillum aerium]